MSWQAYVDSNLVGSGHITKAGIFSRAGDSTWAASPGFTPSGAELKAVASALDNPGSAFATGFHVCGEKYMTLRSDDRSLYGKKGSASIFCVSTKQAIIIALQSEGVPGNAASVIESLADYLIGVGY